MTETAAGSLNRIVQMVAEVSRDPEGDGEGVRIQDLAERLGTTAAQVQKDLRTLTAISDEPGAEWLQSLSVWQEGDRVSAASRGPWRRPLRFTPDEMLAIRVGLALEGPDGEALARRLGESLGGGEEAAPVDLFGPNESGGRVHWMARDAIDRGEVMTIKYAGGRDRAGRTRAIEPHQVVIGEGRAYIVAWCREAQDWRHFRLDRVLDAAVNGERFARRADFVPVHSPSGVFRGADDADEVTVRYSPRVSRWLEERFPDAKVVDGGSLEVTYRVVEPLWLVSMVLKYGAEAEVIAPESYREMILRDLRSSSSSIR